MLLIDGFSAHQAGIDRIQFREKQLPFIEIEFLPTNSTSKCQPLDQGIIRTFKAYYRKQWLSFIIEELDADRNPFESMNLLQALRWCQHAWEQQVSATTIENYWLKSRVLAPEALPRTEQRQREWDAALAAAGKSEDEVQAALLSHMKNLQDRQFIKVALTLNQLLNPVNEVVTDSLDDDELLDTIMEAHLPAEEVDDDVASEVRSVPIEEALEALKTLREWVLQQPQEEPEFLRNIGKVASRLQKAKQERVQQVTLDRYFFAGRP